MNFFVQRSELRGIYDKVVAGERISEADALRLFESTDLNAVGAIADFVRQKKNGNRASFIINRYINYSNYCILSCQFCSFARKKRDADGFQLSVEEMVAKAREALKIGITELHIVGGLHPSLPFSYYTDMLRALNALNDEVGRAVPCPPPDVASDSLRLQSSDGAHGVTRPTLSDSAEITRRDYARAKSDLSATVCDSENGRRLLAIPELRDDVAFCLQRDICPLIAKMESDGAIRQG